MTGTPSPIEIPPEPRGLRAVPPGVFALGFVSLFMDVSSEMIHALLPAFLVTVLGASAVTLGWIEGVAEGTASFTKIVSGALSDRLRRPKLLAALGYGLAALTKPLFPLAPTVGWVFAARFLDRVGKGIRGAPRDALVADLTPENVRGASYGLRQALDTVGALAGPLAATLLMLLFSGDVRRVLWVAVAPALVATALIVFAVREPPRAAGAPEAPRAALRARDLRALGPRTWRVVAVAAVLSLARFSEAFLLLRAADVGLETAGVPLVLVAMNVTYAATSYPVGRWADAGGRARLLSAGFAALAVSDVVLALASAPAHVFVGALLWGLHLGLTQGLLAALVADAAPARLRGTAFGIFHFVSGLAGLAASVAAGALWEAAGAPAPFAAGAALALAGLAALAMARRRG